jgi:amidohydrolase
MALKNWLIETRRDLHRHPEIGFQEVRTAGIVTDTLVGSGLETRTGVGGTGVIGLWRADRPGPGLGLRADMDALSLEEATGQPWASTIPGVMHACGHDLHTTMLLGAARYLAQDQDLSTRLAGTVKFIFQPAEEGGGGAAAMIADGALDDPPLSAVFAGHVVPILKVGQIGFTTGTAMASVDNFFIEVRGRGGHAAHPELALDPIEPAARLVLRLKDKTRHLQRALVAVCTVQAGTQTNIIPARTLLSGTIRSLKKESRAKALAEVQAAVDELKRESADSGLEIILELIPSYPMLINDQAKCDLFLEVAGQALGQANVVDMGPSFGAEDLAYFLEQVPGMHYWLGCGRPEQQPLAMLHSPQFDPDEDVLPLGVEIMIRLVEKCLGQA